MNYFSTNRIDISRLTRWNDSLKVYLFNIFEFNNYLDEIRGCLSEDELSKVHRIKLTEMQNRFVLRKGITRLVLSGHFKIQPDTLKYTYNAYGKPFLQQDEGQKYFFNISHSEQYLMIAVRRNRSVGVDIEKINPGLDYHNLIHSVLSEEEIVHFAGLDRAQQLRSFYKAWVQKEAISKALGVGLSIGFHTITVNIHPSSGIEKYFVLHNGTPRAIDTIVLSKPGYYQAIALLQRGG